MINRYSLTNDGPTLATRFGVDPTDGYSPVYNGAPTHLLPVLTQESPDGFSFFYWGAPPLMANQKPLGERLINTPAESIPDKPSLRKKLKTHRCLIPADGFYLWKKIGKKSSIPYRFTLADQSPFLIAGIWEEYEDEQDIRHHTFSMLTTASNESVLEYAERMPAILPTDRERAWLTSTDENEWISLVSPNPTPMTHYAVSALINNPQRNDRRVIQAVPPADQFGNLTLFD